MNKTILGIAVLIVVASIGTALVVTSQTFTNQAAAVVLSKNSESQTNAKLVHSMIFYELNDGICYRYIMNHDPFSGSVSGPYLVGSFPLQNGQSSCPQWSYGVGPVLGYSIWSSNAKYEFQEGFPQLVSPEKQKELQEIFTKYQMIPPTPADIKEGLEKNGVKVN